MANIPAKIQSRLVEGLKKFQPIVESAKSRDVNESDTVVILTGILSEVFGYDRYTDITTELAIRGTYCDLALKINNKIEILLEAKAVGIDLKEQQVKQAVDYAANKGLEWVILTNGVEWKVFKLLFTKPIQNILVADINFLNLKFKSNDDLELLYTLTKEAVIKKSLEEFYTQKQATNKFMIGNLLACDGVVASIKKELKGIYPEIKVTNEEIHNVLFKEVIKREITEGDEADEAKKKINKALKKKEKDKEKASSKPNGLTPVNESETPKAEETLN
ncbi:MAG TPA: type I restriction enzyme HsdR N-terminal domain-containing protein [Bacteroidia bacterium]|nr:type I restriction enzyme HsdR N-terminal domain-containing protein [Bacteroidia bacterium]